MKFQKPKGTVDYLPELKVVQNKIFDLCRDTARRYGYQEIETPAFENLTLLTEKEGEDIKGQIFTLTKRSNEELGLRFDLTVPATRLFIENQKSLPKPVKWFSLSRMWRYEQPQAGRLREFYQFNVECFGSDKPESDAELISLLIDFMLSLGLTEKDFVVQLNNRKLLQGLLVEIVTKQQLDQVIRIIDKRDKIGEEAFKKELKGIGLDEKQIIQLDKIILSKNINEFEDLNEEATQGLQELNAVLDFLGEKKKFVQVDLSTARGLAYYTGTVFEVFDSKKRYRSIVGGGRYDSLVNLFGGESTPATGFALGYATLLMLLEEKKLIPKVDLSPDYFIITINDDMKPKALEIAQQLRKKYTVTIDLMGRTMKKQFSYANTIQAKKVIVVGPNEIRDGKVKIRDMETGKEENVALSGLKKL